MCLLIHYVQRTCYSFTCPSLLQVCRRSPSRILNFSFDITGEESPLSHWWFLFFFWFTAFTNVLSIHLAGFIFRSALVRIKGTSSSASSLFLSIQAHNRLGLLAFHNFSPYVHAYSYIYHHSHYTRSFINTSYRSSPLPLTVAS